MKPVNLGAPLGPALAWAVRALQMIERASYEQDPRQMSPDAVKNTLGYVPYLATLDTIDGTAATLATIPIDTDRTVVITAEVGARRTGGSAGAPGDAAGYVMNCVARNIGGTVTIIGYSDPLAAEDQAAWGALFDVSGTNVRLRVTGEANTNITWKFAGRAMTT